VSLRDSARLLLSIAGDSADPSRSFSGDLVLHSIGATGDGPNGMGIVSGERHKDPRIVKTDAHSLEALAQFGPGGAALADWERAAGRANDTFYKSRDRLVEARKVRFDEESARYLVVETSAGPGPEAVQNMVQLDGVQKVSPEVPP